MNKYPMRLVPYMREMIWGGDRLKRKFSKEASSDKIGEAWELTCRPEAVSVIANGEYSGEPLASVLGCGYDFPLLIKFIDACDKLSVQVHPDDDICDESGTPLGKTEMWYIIDADKDAFIIYGLCDGVTVEDLAAMVKANDYESGLKKVYVKPGDCYFIPAGQVHAIGKGILLAEIQQNSDTTYRFYDYGRISNDGKPRELHVEKALNVTRARSESEINMIRYSKGAVDGCLANCDKFKCLKHLTTNDSPVSIQRDVFISLIFIEGEGYIECDGVKYPAKSGDTYYIPEELSISVCGSLLFLEASAS